MDAPDGGYGTNYTRTSVAGMHSHDAATNSSLPLAGAILCCTAIGPEDRTELGIIGAQMGAIIKLDLTSDVTHLIVGSTDSAKYRYVAKSRDDVKVFLPQWLKELRDVWMAGEDNLDVAKLEREHRLPIFYGLKICLTGFDNPDQRRYIQETIDDNGGEYHGDLTKSVTHLIAATASGKKYDYALTWKQKVVSLEWFEQSFERGMVLNETLYHPTMPVEARGVGAWDRKQYPSPTLGKRTRDAEQAMPLKPFRRKLRRAASTKMGNQSEALWAGITAPGLERQQDDEDNWAEDIAKQDISQLSEPATRVEAGAAHHNYAPPGPIPRDQSETLHASDVALNGIFGARIIVPYGFDKEKTSILQRHLASHGARVIGHHQLNTFSPDDLRRGYLVVPHDAEVDLTALPERAGSTLNVVTNWWVERCLHGKNLVDPTNDVLSRPFDTIGISGFSDLTINSTGFVGIELLHVTKVVTLMGATYDEQLSAKTTVMICNSRSPNPQKLKFATDKSIAAVHVTWLYDCLRTGSLQAFGDHQLNDSTLVQQRLSKKESDPSPEVPTAKLSEEDSIKLRQRKAQTNNEGKKPLKPQNPRALDLAPSVDPTPASLTYPNTSTNYSGDADDTTAGVDGEASLPLQYINGNSPRHRSSSSNGSKPASRERSSSAESLIRAVPAPCTSKRAKEPSTDSIVLPDSVAVLPQEVRKEPEAEKDYSDILAQLRANRKAAPTPADQADEKRRRRRQLGRATSARSNQSTGESSGHVGLDVDEDENTVVIEEYQPSQQLGWDSPGAAKAREQMIKKLGGTLKETSVPVQGIGVVKDASETTGRGTRKRRG